MAPINPEDKNQSSPDSPSDSTKLDELQKQLAQETFESLNTAQGQSRPIGLEESGIKFEEIQKWTEENRLLLEFLSEKRISFGIVHTVDYQYGMINYFDSTGIPMGGPITNFKRLLGGYEPKVGDVLKMEMDGMEMKKVELQNMSVEEKRKMIEAFMKRSNENKYLAFQQMKFILQYQPIAVHCK